MAVAVAVTTARLYTPTLAELISNLPADLAEKLEEHLRAATLATTFKNEDAARERMARGRAQGAAVNRERRKAHHAAIVDRARTLKADKPYLTLDALTAQIWSWCPTSEIGFVGKENSKLFKAYTLRTVHGILKRAGF